MTATDRMPLRGLPLGRLPRPSHDPGELRGTLGRFTTGVTILTAGRETPRGMTASSFTSVSLDPALILVCVVRTAAIHEVVLAERAFAVSVLSGPQESLARHFAGRHRPRGAAEFEDVGAVPGRHTGAPVLDGAQAWLECELAAVHDGGDHSIFVGSVLDMGRGATDDPLVYFRGGFHRIGG